MSAPASDTASLDVYRRRIARLHLADEAETLAAMAEAAPIGDDLRA